MCGKTPAAARGSVEEAYAIRDTTDIPERAADERRRKHIE